MTGDDDATIRDEAALRRVYRHPLKAVRDKAIDYLDDFALKFISLSPFFCIGTSRPDSLADVSPRGGEKGFVHALNRKQLAFPDRPGNNRLDTFVNLMHSPAVGLLFLIPGIDDTLRINGTAGVSVRGDLMARFAVEGKTPRSVVIVDVMEVYLHCTKALRRSDLWNPENYIARSELPTWGEMLHDQRRTIIPARLIDFMIDQDAKKNL